MSAGRTTLSLLLLLIVVAPAWSQAAAEKERYARAQMDKGEQLREQGDALNAAIAFHESGQAWFQLRQYARCKRAYEACLPLTDSIDEPPQDLIRAVAQAHLGSVAMRFEDLEDAEQHLTRARDLAVKLEHAEVELLCQSNLGDLHKNRGQYAEARAALERAMLISEAMKDVGNQVAVAQQMSDVSRVSGDHAQAREWFDRADTLSRDLDDDQVRADVLLTRGRFHESRMALRPARNDLEDALDKAVVPRSRAAILGHLGNVYRHMGEFSRALDCYQETLAIGRDMGDLGLEIPAYISIGLIYKEMGDDRTAKQHMERSLAMMGEDAAAAQRATTLYQLAMAHLELGDHDTATRLLEESLALGEEAGGPVNVAQSLSGMAVALFRQERYEEALEYTRRHGAMSDIPESRLIALHNEAYILLEMGELDAAREASIASLAEARTVANNTHLLNTMGTRARIALRDGDVELTRALLGEADRLLADLTAWDLGIQQAARQRAQDPYSGWSEVQQDMAALQLPGVEPGSRAWEIAVGEGFYQAGLGQGRALLHGIAEHRKGLRSAEATALRRSLAEARADREALQVAVSESIRGGTEETHVDGLRSRLGELDARVEVLVADLNRVAPRDAHLDAPRGVRHEEVASDILGPNEALIQYVNGEDRIYAYVVTPDAIRWRDIGATDDVRAASRAHLDGMRDPSSLASPADIAATGRPLHDMLLSDLVPEDTERLLIVPTAELSDLPFEALVVTAEDAPSSFEDMTFVVDHLEVAYGASTSVLSLLSRTGPREEPGRMLILGDPRYGRELAAADGDPGPRPRSPALPMDFVRLPGTRDEALGIARVIEQDTEVTDGRDVSLTTERFTLRLGTEATPSPLSEGGREYSVIHCAAHGYVDPEDARLSGIALTPDGEVEQDDGYLSVSEILELDLDANLAVLSACETGRGEVLPGEGVQSVARAFAYAGARSVIASLWQVDDRETAETMKAFYGRYLTGELPASAALREARLATRHGKATPDAYLGIGRGKRIDSPGHPRPESRPGLAGHPYFWAPFIYIGLPR